MTEEPKVTILVFLAALVQLGSGDRDPRSDLDVTILVFLAALVQLGVSDRSGDRGLDPLQSLFFWQL